MRSLPNMIFIRSKKRVFGKAHQDSFYFLLDFVNKSCDLQIGSTWDPEAVDVSVAPLRHKSNQAIEKIDAVSMGKLFSSL